jgi:DNA-binding NarL/FixJ family response regulator
MFDALDTTSPDCENRAGWFCWGHLGVDGSADETRQITSTAVECLVRAGAAVAAGKDLECSVVKGHSCRDTSKRRACAQCVGRVSPRQMWEELARRLELSQSQLLLVQGVFHDCKELAIARRLDITANTVHTYFARLYKQLGVSSHVGLVQIAYSQLQLLYPPIRLTPE